MCLKVTAYGRGFTASKQAHVKSRKVFRQLKRFNFLLYENIFSQNIFPDKPSKKT
jgi:hypothetical protein